jgi:hypothetical protein
MINYVWLAGGLMGLVGAIAACDRRYRTRKAAEAATDAATSTAGAA